jgi:hypothetical protein
MLKRKYIGTKALSQVTWKPGDSHFWAGLMATKNHFFRHGTFSIKDGSEIRFWEDRWLDGTPLREQYPALYSIVRYKNETIAKVMDNSPPNVTFRRDLLGQRLLDWNALLQRLANVHLQPGHDEFRWNLHENGKFSVASMYNALIHPDVPIDTPNNNKLWKLKIPLRIKVFGWYLRKGVILTKDNLAKRNWQGSKQCAFCHQEETIKHLFFNCRFARSIWSVIQLASSLYQPRSVTNIFGNWLNGIDPRFKKHIRVGAIAIIWSLWLCRNDKLFNGTNSSLLQVIYRCTNTLRLWSSLQRVEHRELFTEVYSRLEAMARDIFSLHGWQHNLRIEAPPV